MLLADSVYGTREKPESGEPVYSDFQGSSSLLVDKRILYTQTARIRACPWSTAYTVYANSLDPSSLLVDSVYRTREKPKSEEPVYSDFQDPGSLLVDSV